MTIHNYQDILGENVYLYTGGDSLRASGRITNKEQTLASEIQCIRYAFEGLGNDSDMYSTLFKECKEYLFERLFEENTESTYLILAKGNTTLVKLNQDNFNSYIHFILDSRICFIISSEQELSIERFANITYLHRTGDTIASIDYLKLVLDHCTRGSTIYKMSGDGDDNYIAIDVFSKAT